MRSGRFFTAGPRLPHRLYWAGPAVKQYCATPPGIRGNREPDTGPKPPALRRSGPSPSSRADLHLSLAARPGGPGDPGLPGPGPFPPPSAHRARYERWQKNSSAPKSNTYLIGSTRGRRPASARREVARQGPGVLHNCWTSEQGGEWHDKLVSGFGFRGRLASHRGLPVVSVIPAWNVGKPWPGRPEGPGPTRAGVHYPCSDSTELCRVLPHARNLKPDTRTL